MEKFKPHFEQYGGDVKEEEQLWLLERSIKQDIVKIRRGSPEHKKNQPWLPFNEEMLDRFVCTKEKYLQHYPERLEEVELLFDLVDYLRKKNNLPEMSSDEKKVVEAELQNYEARLQRFVFGTYGTLEKERNNNFWQTLKRITFGNEKYKGYLRELIEKVYKEEG